MTRRSLSLTALALTGATLAAPQLARAQAQATVKPDDQFRYALTAAGSYSAGNTSAASVNIDAQAMKASATDKLLFTTKAVWARSDGNVTADNLALGSEYNRDLSTNWFGLGKADYLRDRPANVATRYSLFGGVGRHMVRTDTLTFDLSVGAGYTHDHYVTQAVVNDELRDNYGRFEGLLAEESTHKWSPTTTFHQKLSLYPALRSGGGYRGVFDSGLSVAMTPVLALTVGLNYRYNSDPGAGLKKGDTLVVTGITVKLD